MASSDVTLIEYRKHGIGTMMIEALEKNIKTIRAPVPGNNPDIINHFKNAGFQPSNIISFDRTEPGN